MCSDLPGVGHEAVEHALSHKQVLVIDDNPMNLMIHRDFLYFNGFDVLEAQNAEEGERIAKAHLPDLIILDLRMADKSGIELTRNLKADPLTLHIPIIALTALVMPDVKQEFLKAGGDVFVTKPFDPAQMRQIINQLLAG